MSALREMLMVHEGIRDRMYIDSVGVRTIGCGHSLETGPPLSPTAIAQILDDDIAFTRAAMEKRFSWFSHLDDVRQDALIDMGFNLGLDGLAKFKNMLAALKIGDWDMAAKQALSSQWASQVGNRSKTVAEMLRYGRYA